MSLKIEATKPLSRAQGSRLQVPRALQFRLQPLGVDVMLRFGEATLPEDPKTMRPQDLIAIAKNGAIYTNEQLDEVIRRIKNSELTEADLKASGEKAFTKAQVAALVMAMHIRHVAPEVSQKLFKGLQIPRDYSGNIAADIYGQYVSEGEDWLDNQRYIWYLLDKRLNNPTGPNNRFNESEINTFVDMMLGKEKPQLKDYEIAMWLMAVRLLPLDVNETAYLTNAYAKSGVQLEGLLRENLAGKPIVDKHSTGGVGDKTTLVLGPMLAACGVYVPKLTGRGLDISGGTVDKLESIPGFNAALTAEELVQNTQKTGLAVSGQSSDLAPADYKTYVLRDETSTVDDIGLIAASVVGKKLAVGADVIVLDIKVGEGAFMKTLADAKALAQRCEEVGKQLGKKVVCVITSMDQPLGRAVGNANEVAEAIRTLNGNGPRDLEKLCLELGAVALVQAGTYRSKLTAKWALKRSLLNGQAFERFKNMVEAQGGNLNNFWDKNDYTTEFYRAEQSGFITRINPREIALAAKVLGAGREQKSDTILSHSGIYLADLKIGQNVTPNTTLATIEYKKTELDEQSDKKIALAKTHLEKAFELSPTYPKNIPPLVYQTQGFHWDVYRQTHPWLNRLYNYMSRAF